MIERILKKFGDMHRKVGAITVARSVGIVSALLVMMALTRILDPSDYGAYKKMWLVFILLSPGITSMLVKTLYYRSEVAGSSHVVWTIISIGAMASVIVALIISLGSEVLASLLQTPELSTPLQWFGIYTLLATYSSVSEPIFVHVHRKKWLVGYNITYNFIEMCLIIVPFYLGYPLETVVKFMIAGPLMRSIFVSWFAYKQVGGPDFLQIKKEIPPSLNYGLGVLLIFITGVGVLHIDKLIVATLVDSDEQYAIYVVGAQQLPIVPAFISSISAALVVQYSAQLYENELKPALNAIKAATNRLFLLITPLIVVSFFMAEPIMVVLFDQYAESAPIFQIYAIALIHRLFLAEPLLLATGKPRVIAGISVAEILLNIPMSLMLLPAFGILGPAIATLIAHFAGSFAMIVYVSKSEKISMSHFMPSGKIWPLLVTLPVLGIICYILLQTGFHNLIILALSGVACGLIILFHNREYLPTEDTDDKD